MEMNEVRAVVRNRSTPDRTGLDYVFAFGNKWVLYMGVRRRVFVCLYVFLGGSVQLARTPAHTHSA